jgi:hypothetical protein
VLGTAQFFAALVTITVLVIPTVVTQDNAHSGRDGQDRIDAHLAVRFAAMFAFAVARVHFYFKKPLKKVRSLTETHARHFSFSRLRIA